MSNLKNITPDTKENKEEEVKTTLKLTDEKKKLDTAKDSTIVDSTEEITYTTSPDGKYKIPVSEFDSDRLEENRTNIPQIKIPGWVVCWPDDRKASTLGYMVDKGYSFVSPNEPGCEAVSRKVVAGNKQTGEPAFHYAMKIPECKFKELQAREEKERKDLLESVAKAPSEESKAIYATEEMKINRGSV